MPSHWTYESFQIDSDLEQGDILHPTEELRNIFQEVHKNFLDPKYIAFILLTQSCDLIIRKGKRKARYLNIAVICELESVLHDLLSHICKTLTPGVYFKESKSQAKMLLERLFGQNEQALGLFYLHPDNDAGITVPAVAMLRISVTLRADHYNILKQARRGRLTTEF